MDVLPDLIALEHTSLPANVVWKWRFGGLTTELGLKNIKS